MTKSDWLDIGLKILGAYFVISGVAVFWRAILTIMVSGRTPGGAGGAWIPFFLPLVELIGGFLLIMIRWRAADTHPRRTDPHPTPDYLENLERRDRGEN